MDILQLCEHLKTISLGLVFVLVFALVQLKLLKKVQLRVQSTARKVRSR